MSWRLVRFLSCLVSGLDLFAKVATRVLRMAVFASWLSDPFTRTKLTSCRGLQKKRFERRHRVCARWLVVSVALRGCFELSRTVPRVFRSLGELISEFIREVEH